MDNNNNKGNSVSRFNIVYDLFIKIKGWFSKASNSPKSYLFFDTETTGLPKDQNASSSDVDNWPRIVQLSWILTDDKGNKINTGDYIIKPSGFIIPEQAASIHGISTEKAIAEGTFFDEVIDLFLKDYAQADCIVGHNISFDQKVLEAELIRMGRQDAVVPKQYICTMKGSVNYCKIPGRNGIKYKYPNLQELHKALFGSVFENAHNSASDIAATEKCFWEMKKRGWV